MKWFAIYVMNHYLSIYKVASEEGNTVHAHLTYVVCSINVIGVQQLAVCGCIQFSVHVW